MDVLENYLVLEDDVVFHDDASAHLARLMAEIPKHWDQLYLGGQHLAAPELVKGSPFVFQCNNVNRTHAFALRRKVFQHFQQHISHAPDYIAKGAWHVDHQLGLAHERRLWSTYAPTWWLAGQDECMSNIQGRMTPRFWWHYEGYSGGLPFFCFQDYLQNGNRGQLLKHFHFGNNLKGSSLEDIGLDACVGSPDNLHTWLKMIAKEAMDHWKLPAISHPLISKENVAALWASGVRNGPADDAFTLINYPGNGLFPHALNEGIRISTEDSSTSQD